MKKNKIVSYLVLVCLLATGTSLGGLRDHPGAGNVAIIVIFDDDNNRYSFATGMFLTDDVVITAAHAVYKANIAEVFVLKRSEDLLYMGQVESRNLSVVSEIMVMPQFLEPDYIPQTRICDIALLKLAEPDPLPGYEGFKVKIGNFRRLIEDNAGEKLWPLRGVVGVNDVDPNFETLRFLKKSKRFWSGDTARRHITNMQQELINCGVGANGDIGLNFMLYRNHLNAFFVTAVTEHEYGMSGAILYGKSSAEVPDVYAYAIYVGGVLFSDINCNDTSYPGYGAYLDLNFPLYREWIMSNVDNLTYADVAGRYMRQTEEAVHEQSQSVYWNPATGQSQTVRFELREEALFGPPIALDEMIEADSMRIRYTVDHDENIIGDIDISFEALAYGNDDKMYPVFVEGTLYQPRPSHPDRHELELTVSFTRYNAHNPYPGQYFYRHPPDGVALGGSFTLRVPYADGYDDYTILMDTIESFNGGGGMQ